MGTTATSLHVLSAVGSSGPRLQEDIEKAYRKLGYTRPKKAGAAAAKRVILAPDASGDWLSIYDWDNDRIDTGELKQLAVELTKKLGTCALLTSVNDSDSFEFVMFHRGKQVDAAVSDPEGHTGGLKMLKGARRARAWHSMFIGRDLPRAVLAGRQGRLLEYWEERLREPPAPAAPFAEVELAAWCTLAGLSPGNATMVSEDLIAREDRTGMATLLLEHIAPKQPKSLAAPTGTSLAYSRSDDDCPQLRFFPAPWPWQPGVPGIEQWTVLCSDGGISGLRLRLCIDGPAPVRLARVHVRALPFYNGQVTSMTAIAGGIGARVASPISSWERPQWCGKATLPFVARVARMRRKRPSRGIDRSGVAAPLITIKVQQKMRCIIGRDRQRVADRRATCFGMQRL